MCFSLFRNRLNNFKSFLTFTHFASVILQQIMLLNYITHRIHIADNAVKLKSEVFGGNIHFKQKLVFQSVFEGKLFFCHFLLRSDS